MGTPFISLLEPSKLEVYDRTKPHDQQPNQSSIAKTFLDAMEVREIVFVDEQKMPLEYEYDEDDPRSCHWVMYASVNQVVEQEQVDLHTGNIIRPRRSETRSQPIATLRIVPFPQPPHPKPGGWYEDYKLVDRPSSGPAAGSVSGAAPAPSPTPAAAPTATATSSSEEKAAAAAATGLGVGATTLAAAEFPPPYAQDRATTFHDGQEPYVKIGRLAVHPTYRGRRIAGQLWAAARRWLEEHPRYFDPSVTERGMEALGGGRDVPGWNGLVCAHAQEAAVKVYQGWGFQVDEGMGRWFEEGVPHVGMFTRLNV
ncbi:hypothetical protein PG999_002029 [Apiospora kogelbergensis]|uniref:N-acetyltransferase domain-containing protein n=1 Tax=Apiospora kogelbergensis TaxID=1337665 RepID=A0AAW0R777_9PEZI